ASEKGEVGIHLAEHAFALLLGLTRGVHTALRTPDYSLREPIRREQRELYQLTMGIVGFGGTGREVARRALGFGMAVLAVDTAGGSPRRAGRVIATFCENLRRLRSGRPLLALIDKRKGY